jgi:hypothetical protein
LVAGEHQAVQNVDNDKGLPCAAIDVFQATMEGGVKFKPV